MELSNKYALVCGASQGIGKAIAFEFAKLGANVTIISRNESKLQTVITELKSLGNAHYDYIAGDFSNPEMILNSLNVFLNQGRKYHILVNNTGGPAPGEIQYASVESLNSAFTQHVIASQMLAQALLPGMKEEAFGRIINIISIGLKQPIHNLGVSNTIRGAMGSWAKTLAREVAPFGITVNNLLPGHTFTPRLEALIKSRADQSGKTEQEISRKMTAEIPVGRFGKPEDLAYAAGFLASEKASFITGASLPVDGGWLECL